MLSHCDFATGAGIPGTGLDEEQQELLLELNNNGVGIADEATAAAELTAIEGGPGETWIGCSRATVADTTRPDTCWCIRPAASGPAPVTKGRSRRI